MSERTSSYARAIVEVAQAEGALETVETELLEIARALDGNDELRETLADNSRPVGQRLAMLDSDGMARASRPTRAAVAMVIASDNGADLSDIAHDVAEQAATARDAQLAEVMVATSLDDAQKRRLAEALEQQVGRKLDVRFFVDPSVVGGVRAKVGDTVIDGSVASRIDDIRSRLS